MIVFHFSVFLKYCSEHGRVFGFQIPKLKYIVSVNHNEHGSNRAYNQILQ